jgi:cytochrome c oxidase subunit 2
VLAWGLAIPVIVLLIILFYSLGVGRTFATEPFKDAMNVNITGKQWWWQIRYMKGSDVIAATANEIHLPAGTPVRFTLQSNDVIHSFWVPNLSGKMDLIPGRTNEIWLRADREGVWRGECAEFCGVQHAHMALEVIAEPPAKFYGWLQRQRQPAPEPSSDLARRGRDIFLKGPCVMCHKISGTPAGGSVGPDLTHVAGRRTIAAATLPNNRGNMAGWIVNAQGVKPGSQMPRINLSAEELEALLSYLETLQ